MTNTVLPKLYTVEPGIDLPPISGRLVEMEKSVFRNRKGSDSPATNAFFSGYNTSRYTQRFYSWLRFSF